MKSVSRRLFLSAFVSVSSVLRALTALPLRGLLTAGRPARLKRTDASELELTGDPPTLAVLADQRLHGAEVELLGRAKETGKFEVLPIHQRGLFVLKNGKKLLVSYWCDVCAIRTYAPGKCMCCQDDTALDLKESFDP